MSKDDIERAIREAESHASDDRSRKEEADVRNEGDSICYAVERQIKELGDKVSAGEKSRAEMLVSDLRQKLKDGADLDTLKSIMNELRGALVLLQQAARPAPGEGDDEWADDGEYGADGEVEYQDDQSGYKTQAEDVPYDPFTGTGIDNQAGMYEDSGGHEEAGFTASGDEVVDAEFRQTDE